MRRWLISRGSCRGEPVQEFSRDRAHARPSAKRLPQDPTRRPSQRPNLGDRDFVRRSAPAPCSFRDGVSFNVSRSMAEAAAFSPPSCYGRFFGQAASCACPRRHAPNRHGPNGLLSGNRTPCRPLNRFHTNFGSDVARLGQYLRKAIPRGWLGDSPARAAENFVAFQKRNRFPVIVKEPRANRAGFVLP